MSGANEWESRQLPLVYGGLTSRLDHQATRRYCSKRSLLERRGVRGGRDDFEIRLEGEGRSTKRLRRFDLTHGVENRRRCPADVRYSDNDRTGRHPRQDIVLAL